MNESLAKSYGLKKKKGRYPSAGFALDGFYRVNIVDPDGKIKGDSGWNHNVITNLGLANYIAYAFVSTGGSTRITPAYMHLGSLQSSHASNAVNVTGAYGLSLAAAISTTQHTTRAAQSDGHTARFLTTFVSNSIISTTAQTIAAIGLFHTTNATSMMCGGSFASSTLGNSQAINCTYDIVFSATATT